MLNIPWLLLCLVFFVGTLIKYLHEKYTQHIEDQKQYYLAKNDLNYPAKLRKKNIAHFNFKQFTFEYGHRNKHLGATNEQIEIVQRNLNEENYFLNEEGKMYKSKIGMPLRFKTNVLVNHIKPGCFKVSMNPDNKKNETFYKIMDSLETNSYIYISGPYGNWKYLESPGKFHCKVDDSLHTFKRILIICENDNYLGVIGIIRNEICQDNVCNAVDLRIIFIADSMANIIDLPIQEFLQEHKVGRVKCISQDESIRIMQKVNPLPFFKYGTLTEDDIQGIAPIPNEESLVIVGVSDERKMFVKDVLKNIGFEEWQILNN